MTTLLLLIAGGVIAVIGLWLSVICTRTYF